MTWLGEWLKQIIFVVLLSSFIEMLLPNRSMERYVKMVLSLLVLMTLLNPILKLFSGNPVEKLQQAIEEQLNPKGSTRSGLEQILKQGELLRQSSLEDSLKWTGNEAAQQMKTQIEAATGLDVDRVAVTLKLEKAEAGTNSGSKAGTNADQQDADTQQYDRPVISGVKVYLNPAEAEAVMASPEEKAGQEPDANQSASAITVPKVQQVQVGIGRIEIEAAPVAAEAPEVTQNSAADDPSDGTVNGSKAEEDESAAAAPESEETRKIRSLLESSWDIEDNKIRIYQLQNEASP
ncbi:stage III sporulation protein AF [Paenibacillus pinistramenti]|uniref:stage III sporulation protein AF n=1 Tax=Paenibacillus pinistramenti TaxID=1768003 RepID=UPI001109C59C|nr:stage III sporulation protein AF [Paenibacillus pinistramenti]